MSDIKVRLHNVVKDFGTPSDKGVRAVDSLSLDIYDGEFFALLGPSGCGKTTTLRLIAGFEQPTSGEIYIGGQAMAGIDANQRPVNTVFQDYALFPHMNVLQNVTFGLEMERIPQREAIARAHQALELVRLPNLARRKPRELSGGQQQRVALARALVKRPQVLLLDEPLGALDLKLRREMQLELKALQRELGITFVLVTHDQEEAMTMANRIAVMHEGRLLQVGRADEIYETPATRFVADFIGETNFLSGRVLVLGEQQVTIGLEGESELRIHSAYGKDHLAPQQAVTVAIRPERLSLLAQDAPVPADLNSLSATIIQADYIGTDMRYSLRLANDAVLSVRLQNTDFRSAFQFKERQVVRVLWSAHNSRILTE